ncbi:MAG TPA: hypothetical protein VGJ20_31265 [Xanthobacteraceae bacterium]|jgi:hypothetical protein
MRRSITIGFAALTLGTAFSSSAALAQQSASVAGHPTRVSVARHNSRHRPRSVSGRASSATVAQSAPLSPGGVGAAADSFGGPGYMGPDPGPGRSDNTRNYSVVDPPGGPAAPLSPGGIGTGANSFGGPGYSGASAGASGYRSSNYSISGLHGAPLSPGGIGAAADSFGGPGYNGP